MSETVRAVLDKVQDKLEDRHGTSGFWDTIVTTLTTAEIALENAGLADARILTLSTDEVMVVTDEVLDELAEAMMDRLASVLNKTAPIVAPGSPHRWVYAGWNAAEEDQRELGRAVVLAVLGKLGTVERAEVVGECVTEIVSACGGWTDNYYVETDDCKRRESIGDGDRIAKLKS